MTQKEIKKQLAERWGMYPDGLVAFEYRVSFLSEVNPDEWDYTLWGETAKRFNDDCPGYFIELKELNGNPGDIIPVLTTNDGWYICCVDGRGNIISMNVHHTYKLTEIIFIKTLSDIFHQYAEELAKAFHIEYAQPTE